jgi:putative peptidoglycan lipid II flippase
MTERLARSAGLIGLATLSSRLLGVVRNAVLANIFGVGLAMDAYNVATRLPSLLRELFAEGAMSAAFVPTFTRALERGGREAAWRLGSQVINALLVATGALVLLGIAFAGPLVGLYGAGYADEPEKLALTVSLTRITLPFLTLIALAAALMGMSNALRRFFLPALSPAMFNVVIIASAVASAWVSPWLGVDPIYGLAVGFVLGGFGQMAVQWPALRRDGYRHRWVLDVRDPAMREVLMLMGPGALGQAGAQINLLVNTYLATHEIEGAVTYLNWAFQLMYMPIGIFGVSVATASIPDMARHAARGAHDAMRSTVSSAMRLMLMLSVPAAVGLVAIAVPIVELTLQTGAFGRDDTLHVARALIFYAPGLIGYSTVKILTPGFYALQDARTPVTIGGITVVTNIVLNLILVRQLGFVGLALGTTIAATVNSTLLLLFLRRRLGGIDGARILTAFAKIVLAALVMGVAAHATEAALRDWLPVVPTPDWMPVWVGRVLARLIRVGGAIGVALGVLAAAAHLLRIHEFRQAMARVYRRR